MRAWQSLGSVRKIVSTYESYARYQWVPMGDLSMKSGSRDVIVKD